MYTLAVRREFIARHFLIGGDWGAENFPNSHHYVLELQLTGIDFMPRLAEAERRGASAAEPLAVVVQSNR